MTTTATHAYVTAIANGTASIPFDFQAAGEGEVSVKLDGVLLDYITDYTITLNGDSTGFVVPGSDWGTAEVFIYSTPTFQQPFNFTRFGAFFPDQFVPPLDRLARGLIALVEDVKRSIKGPFGVPGLEITNTPDTVIGTDGDGNIAQLDSSAFQGIPGPPGNIADLEIVTPYMFGAVGATIVSNPAAVVTDQATLDTSADDSIALQAFFDDAFLVQNANKVYDWSGHWAISKPLYFVRPLVNTGNLNVEYHGRRFIGGTIHVLPVAQQPGGVPMNAVLTISGPNSWWGGHIHIHAGDRGTEPYASRRFKYGLRIIQGTESDFDKITVYSAKKDAVWIDGQYETWTERVGTPYEMGSVSKNNIAVRFNAIYGVNCGSCNMFGVDQPRSLGLTVSSKTQGGDPGETNTFDATPASYAGGHEQRTRLTVPTTADLTVGDFGRMRSEVVPATFTTIAANNAAGTITWTAGDPAAAGLAVGMKFTLEDTGNVGVNDGVEFEILALGGTSNRTITVYPKPTTETARVYSRVLSEWSLHRVMTVLDGTKVAVFPWVPDGFNSKFYLISGFTLRTTGNDTANVEAGYVGALWSGGGLAFSSFYGPKVGNLLVDIGDIGIAHGITVVTVSVGGTISHSHIEGCQWNLAQIGASIGLSLAASSVFDKNTCISLNARAATNSGRQSNYSLKNTNVSYQGDIWSQRPDALGISPDLSFASVSNEPRYAHRVLEADTSTISVSFDIFSARLGYATAEVLWIGGTGGVPSGTATFALTTELAGKGWTLAGATAVATPGKQVLFKLIFDYNFRKVTILKIAVD